MVSCELLRAGGLGVTRDLPKHELHATSRPNDCSDICSFRLPRRHTSIESLETQRAISRLPPPHFSPKSRGGDHSCVLGTKLTSCRALLRPHQTTRFPAWLQDRTRCVIHFPRHEKNTAMFQNLFLWACKGHGLHANASRPGHRLFSSSCSSCEDDTFPTKLPTRVQRSWVAETCRTWTGWLMQVGRLSPPALGLKSVIALRWCCQQRKLTLCGLGV